MPPKKDDKNKQKAAKVAVDKVIDMPHNTEQEDVLIFLH